MVELSVLVDCCVHCASDKSVFYLHVSSERSFPSILCTLAFRRKPKHPRSFRTYRNLHSLFLVVYSLPTAGNSECEEIGNLCGARALGRNLTVCEKSAFIAEIGWPSGMKMVNTYHFPHTGTKMW
ncbi:hypothetical protein, unlikely [Trypanosoma brucei gambiense DAL972]|uniref:Uncharacterized protein n=1 Tax=Trypanosoma brucei gambiense (strain MHOM/CI/86/DAL972) TaxID=679716 RepID=C9ZLD0_TRYB9|nr:hypothetical protein, unlikely [Trypanosoma brucei gambiense DAL972]CBH10139.1 hypothetical protein, unlikely [Trypanosoma brucei gambiense DAL972]|eukprot:XP_011772429.1 hypothetical protein, unlikely [Trypanosoma brucei gambiense DAL972]